MSSIELIGVADEIPYDINNRGIRSVENTKATLKKDGLHYFVPIIVRLHKMTQWQNANGKICVRST